MCDTLAATGAASSDGATWFGKNSDREPSEAQVVEHLPPREGRGRVRCTALEIDDVARTFEVVLSRPLWMWGAEIGVNEKGVAIGNEAISVTAPLEPRGLTGMDLVRLALERAASADEAVDEIRGLIKRHGQGGPMGHRKRGFAYSSSFIVADASTLWVVETAGRFVVGKRVAERAAISNAPTLGADLDLADADAIAFARARGRLRRGADFDFAACFRRPAIDRLAGAARRRACTLGALSRPASLATLTAALRDHGDGHGDTDRARGLMMRGPCAHAAPWPTRTSGQTTGSLVARLARGERPQVWATGTSSPCLSVFKPLALASGRLTDTGPAPGLQADPHSLFWRHERLHRRVLHDPANDRHASDRAALEARVLHGDADEAWRAHGEALDAWLAETRPAKPRGWFGRFWAGESASSSLAP